MLINPKKNNFGIKVWQINGGQIREFSSYKMDIGVYVGVKVISSQKDFTVLKKNSIVNPKMIFFLAD